MSGRVSASRRDGGFCRNCGQPRTGVSATVAACASRRFRRSSIACLGLRSDVAGRAAARARSRVAQFASRSDPSACHVFTRRSRSQSIKVAPSLTRNLTAVLTSTRATLAGLDRTAQLRKAVFFNDSPHGNTVWIAGVGTTNQKVGCSNQPGRAPKVGNSRVFSCQCQLRASVSEAGQQAVNSAQTVRDSACQASPHTGQQTRRGRAGRLAGVEATRRAAIM